ncbi:hypothetical protein SCLCIDRAFT_30622 [Scleroderma citrinum Foug A]|uniref:Fungal-type protein kinase domain-containing protein n=1 Tax=Scleroderma citrinum Foug A TaxID=1036808 RepID=A0A0C2ZRC4_9AGAM|nr:hypothetical protein SCLCIDRAFT_30622 [Scleroderma citrinum Foug A]
MDRLTTQELEGSIIHESRSNGGPKFALGFLIDVIFATCRQESIPNINELTVPLKAIRVRNNHLREKFGGYPESSEVLLYDSQTEGWNWAFDPGDAEEVGGSTVGQSDGTPLHQEKEFTHFLNTVSMAIKHKLHTSETKLESNRIMPSTYRYDCKPDLVLLENELVPCDEILWKSPKVLAELMRESFTPTACIARTLDTKAYLIMIEQPWRRFVLTLSFSKFELCLHYYDCSGGSISPPFHLQRDPQEFLFILTCVVFGPRSCIGFDDTIDILPKVPVPSPLLTPSSTSLAPMNHIPVISSSPPSTQEIYGTIQVRHNIYEVLDILFSSTGFIGRGTVCYLVGCSGRTYVIKDHWVAGDPLHEVNMLMQVQGIEGVPSFVDCWQVKVVDDVVEKTERYREERFRSKMKSIRTHIRLVTTPRMRPLTCFTSRKELVIAIRGILRIQKQAVEEKHVLHRDCSVNNGMIEDRLDGPTGSLIDWEHAVQITKSNEYDVGGTGTVPFISTNLLCQINDALSASGRPLASVHKIAPHQSTSITHMQFQQHFSVRHTYADDIKSLFYAFVWIIIRYNGPLGQERPIPQLSHMTEQALDDLGHALDSKIAFLVNPTASLLRREILPYFVDLFNLADNWRRLHSKAYYTGVSVGFNEVAAVLDEFITTMPNDKKSPEFETIALQLQEDSATIAQTYSSWRPIQANGQMPLKRLHDEVHSMGNAPLPYKQFKK